MGGSVEKVPELRRKVPDGGAPGRSEGGAGERDGWIRGGEIWEGRRTEKKWAMGVEIFGWRIQILAMLGWAAAG